MKRVQLCELAQTSDPGRRVRGDEIVEAREVHVRLPLEVAKAELSSLPEGRLKEELRKAIEYA
jgi:hypothetical protein